MNILDAYKMYFNQIIILIIGMPCTNKSKIAKELSVDLNISLININNYLIKDKVEKISLGEFKYEIYDHIDNYDWDKLNLDVNLIKKSGVIIYGNMISIDKIDWSIDFAFLFTMGNKLCKEKIIQSKILGFKLDNSSQSNLKKKIEIYFYNIFLPQYTLLKDKLPINKFFNLKESTSFEELYDELFDLLMNLINKKLINNNNK